MTKSPLAIAVVALFANCSGGPGDYPTLPSQPTGNRSPGVGTSTTVATASSTATQTDTSATTSTTTTATNTTTSTDDTNVVAIVVDSGPDNVEYVDGAFATVTLCEPGTTTCQTLDHFLVDTGSTGVRVLESAVSLALPALPATGGAGLAECLPFLDGSAWGPVRRADVQIGQKAASNLPIQMIGVSTYPLPSNCTGTPITDLQSLGANGILGVGVYLQDCGSSCQVSGRANPGLYYACSGRTCSTTAVLVAQQVSHPVAAFAADNNGVIIQLPSITAAGAASVAGRMLFGIGTQPNNGLGSSTVLPLDSNGFITTTYPVGGSSHLSFLDSGSNAIFFLTASTANIAQCSRPMNDFYCPSSPLNLAAQLSGTSGASTTVSFSVANATALNTSYFAFDDIAGPMPASGNDASTPTFDWGLPFFFGRNVATSIESQATPAGRGPYFAF